MRTTCGASVTCDAVLDTDDPDDVLVQGRMVHPDVVSDVGVPEGEGLLRVQRAVLDGAGAPLLDADGLGEFLTSRHRSDLFRVETLDHYAVESDAGEFAQYLRGSRSQTWRESRPGWTGCAPTMLPDGCGATSTSCAGPLPRTSATSWTGATDPTPTRE